MKRRTFLGSALAAGLTGAGAAAPDARSARAGRPWRLIACEEGFHDPEVLEAQRKLSGGVSSFGSGLVSGPLVPVLLDVGEGRVRAMDADGVDFQLLLLSSPGVQSFDAATATSLARSANDRLAEAVRAHPTRLGGLAAIAPQDPAGAAAELERATRRLGLKGAVVNSHTHGEYLDDPKYWAIFEAAEALDVPIYIHPREPSPAMAQPLAMPGFTIGWGYAVETGTHALRLIAAGVFDRFPGLRIVLGHLGEGIPFLLERIDDRYRFESRVMPGGAKLRRLPGEYFRENFYVTTSGMNFAAPLVATIATLGIDRVLCAIDYPFEDQRAAVEVIEGLPLSPGDLRRICETSPRRVFRL